jgi:hypothetical protein
VALYEGHLLLEPHLTLFQYYYSVKKEPVPKTNTLSNCSGVTFKIWPNRIYPRLDRHESARYLLGGFFYLKDAKTPGRNHILPPFKDGAPKEHAFWNIQPTIANHPNLERIARRISKLAESSLTGKDITLSWFSKGIQSLKHNCRLMYFYNGHENAIHAMKETLSFDALNKRLRVTIKVPRDIHSYVQLRHLHGRSRSSGKKTFSLINILVYLLFLLLVTFCLFRLTLWMNPVISQNIGQARGRFRKGLCISSQNGGNFRA